MHYTKEQQDMTVNSMNKRKCKLCGQEFIPNVFWQKFCCPEHRIEYWNKVQQEKYETNRRLEEIEKKLGIK